MKKKKKVKEKRKKVWIPNYLALWDWGPRPWAGSWDPPFGMLSDLPKLEVWGLSSPLYSGPIMVLVPWFDMPSFHSAIPFWGSVGLALAGLLGSDLA